LETKNNLQTITHHPQIDMIISDMAPDTLWDKGTDALRSCHLIMETMRIYETLLKKDGKFAIKVFMWPWFEELVRYCRTTRWAQHIKIFKPKACRKESKETYIVKI
jgi:23S rRNA (uridine2552-2'-O)-methyltransferase